MKAFFESTLGKALAVGLVILILSFIGKTWFEEATTPDTKKRSEAASDRLDASVKALEAHLEAKGGALPDPAGWTPASLSCAELAQATAKEAAHPTWATLGIKLDAPTAFQYRFRIKKEGGFELLARTDTDCDGLYEVHRLEGDKGWSGIGTGKLIVDNPGE